MADDTSEIQSIRSGNFKTDGDVHDEVAVVFKNGSTDIVYCKPTDTRWSRTTTNLPVRLVDIAAGDFDGKPANGDEVAGIASGPAPVYFFKSGAAGFYVTATGNVDTSWVPIGAGNFDGGADDRDEVAPRPLKLLPFHCSGLIRNPPMQVKNI